MVAAELDFDGAGVRGVGSGGSEMLAGRKWIIGE